MTLDKLNWVPQYFFCRLILKGIPHPSEIEYIKFLNWCLLTHGDLIRKFHWSFKLKIYLLKKNSRDLKGPGPGPESEREPGSEQGPRSSRSFKDQQKPNFACYNLSQIDNLFKILNNYMLKILPNSLNALRELKELKKYLQLMTRWWDIFLVSTISKSNLYC